MNKINLTESELKVLGYIAEGLMNKVIGQKLFMSEDAVKDRIKSIRKKFGLPAYSPRIEIVNIAYATGLVPCPCSHVSN